MSGGKAEINLESFPTKWADAKLLYPQRPYYNYPEGYFLSRYSSPMRILFTTTNVGIFSGFYALGWAIHKEVNRVPVVARTVAGATILALIHSASNEMFNGLVERNLNKEQFWISNSLAGFTTFIFYHIYENFVRKQPFAQSFTKAKKYVGFMTLGIMLQELYIIHKRDHYLKRQISFDFLNLKLLKPPSAGADEKKDQLAQKAEVKPVSK